MSAVLHMDIEAVERVVRELRTMQGHLAGYVHYMDNHVNGLPPEWKGGAAVEFFDRYGKWRSEITSYADQLGTIADKLAEQAARWAAMDHRF